MRGNFETQKKKKKLILFIAISILLIAVLSLVLYINTQPKYIIPTNADDIILCYFESGIGGSNARYYVIYLDGTAKKVETDTPINGYLNLTEFAKNSQSKTILIDNLTSGQ